MKRRAYTQEEYEQRAAKLARTIAAWLDDNIWPVVVKRSCMFGDPVEIATKVGTACVFWNHLHTDPEYHFTHTPEPIDELRGDDGRVIFRVLRRP